MFEVIFNSVPAHLGFVLDKHPKFNTLAEATALLDHYAVEFACYGYIWDHSKSYWKNQATANGV